MKSKYLHIGLLKHAEDLRSAALVCTRVPSGAGKDTWLKRATSSKVKRIGCSVTTLVFWVGFLGCTSGPTAPTTLPQTSGPTAPTTLPQTSGHVTVSNLRVEPAGNDTFNVRGTVANTGDTTFAFAPQLIATSFSFDGTESKVVTAALSQPFSPSEEQDFVIMGVKSFYPDGISEPCRSQPDKTCNYTDRFLLSFSDGGPNIEGKGCGDRTFYRFDGRCHAGSCVNQAAS